MTTWDERRRPVQGGLGRPWVAVPAFLLLIAALYLAEPDRAFESRVLLPLLNAIFLTGVPSLVAFRAAASVRKGAPSSVLWLGTGMAALALAGLLAGLALLWGLGQNPMVTTHNTGAVLAGICSLAAAVIAAGRHRGADPARWKRNVLLAYGVALALVSVVFVTSSLGHLPPLLEPGGPTMARQMLLWSACITTAIAAVLLHVQRGRAPEPFLTWYAAGLALMAVGFFGVLLPTVVASPASWVGRSAQYLGCVYLLIAMRSVSRDSSWPIPLDQVLRETSSRYQALVEMCPDAIIVHAGRRFVFLNPAASSLYGAENPAQLIGRDVLDHVSPDDRPRVAERMSRVYSSAPTPLAEIAILRCDGTPVTTEATAAPVEYEGSRAILVVLRDIEERKRAEAALRDHEERLQAQATQLAEANRLKDEFLATLSHELRTPLNAILGWSQMLVSKRLDAASAAHALEVIERNARVQTGMINDVLDVSRIISGKLSLAMRTVDLFDCLQAALDSVAPAAQAKQIEIKSEVVPPTLVVGDPDRLQQVLWNLLSNAVKFTPDGGRVIVRIATVGSDVGIEVSDTGIGIDPMFLPHVFERFSQADGSPTKRHGGLGLGLAIVRHLVELHGGTVKAESRGQGLGATVRVMLPAAPAPKRAELRAAPDSRAGLGGQLSGLKLLAVDDEPDARDLLLAVLGSQGAEVRVAATAEEAMERVLEWRPHLLLTDLGMPVQDGYDLIRALRTHPDEAVRRLPTIALTAYGREVDKERVLTAGFDRHVSKPVVPEELIAVVGAVLQARL